MATRDLAAFLDDGALDYLGIKSAKHPEGKTYRVPSPDAKTGLWLAALGDMGLRSASGAGLSAQEARDLKLDDDEEADLYRRVLGPVHAEMVEDGVSWAVLRQVAIDAYICFAVNVEIADVALARSGEGQARANRATRRSAPTSTVRTGKKTGGSSSKKASTDIPARTRSRTSMPSSNATPTGAAEAKAV